MVFMATVLVTLSRSEAKTSTQDINDKDIYQGSVSGRYGLTYPQAGLASTYIGSAVSPHGSYGGYDSYGSYGG